MAQQQQSDQPAEALAPSAAEPPVAWQHSMQPLAQLPPLPPAEMGWMGAPAGWQQPGAWAYGQAQGWDMSAAATAAGYVQPQADYLAQAQAVHHAQAQAQQAGGVIFLCDPRTEEECLHRSLLGLPASQAQIVRTIVPEQSLLFLFNVRTRYLFGIFRAVTWPQENIEPTAWGMEAGGGSKYPLQVRIRVEQQGVLRLPEERVRTLLEYRGSFNRFDLRLSKAHADGLAQLFVRMGEPRGMGMVGGGGSCSSAHPGVAGGPARPPAERAERRERNGLIFVCDPSTEEECLSRRLLGLPKSQSTLLSKLRDTSLLFLFNVRSRQLLGVLQPDGPAGLDLEPAAWGGGRFPVQVRFQPAQPSGQLLMLQETMLGDVLRYRSPSTRFDLLLRGKPLDRLVALFAHHGVPYAPGAASPGAGPSSGAMPPPQQYSCASPAASGAAGGVGGGVGGSVGEAGPSAMTQAELGMSPGHLAPPMQPPPMQQQPAEGYGSPGGAGGTAQPQPPPAGYSAAAQTQAQAQAQAQAGGSGSPAQQQPPLAPGGLAPGSGGQAQAAAEGTRAPLDQMLGNLSLHPQPHPPPG